MAGGEPQVRVGVAPGSGVELSFREWDEPMPADSGPRRLPLLLLHGPASAAVLWGLTAPLLARERRVGGLGQRGHGPSGKPDDGYCFVTIVADALEIGRASGREKG